MRTPSVARAALVLATFALVASTTGLADAARSSIARVVSSPKPNSVLKLDKNARFPARAIPKVASARSADRVGGKTDEQLTGSCDPQTVDLGTWCLQSSPFPLTNEDQGKNDYFFATQACVDAGGWLPTAAQLVGAAARVKLASTIGDSQTTASIDIDPTDGLKDRREMSATLITTAAGSSAAGSTGVSDGSRGDPKTGEPDPVPEPANPRPETLQYVTVYDNGDKGGFAGARPVGTPETFRCGFDKQEGAADAEEGS
ncbi:hypothetical protein [Paraconexibacter algicola]|uniref:hypothetical protein n=1 Tax=Paraconexibacter algicola TaxID=2133960 RepID=UPI0013049976|nr:hypothetical protein [Paraconexibacter algicola]